MFASTLDYHKTRDPGVSSAALRTPPRPIFSSQNNADPMDTDDFFSPYNSATKPRPSSRQTPEADFLWASPSSAGAMPPPPHYPYLTSPALRTPAKDRHAPSHRTALAAKHTNINASPKHRNNARAKSTSMHPPLHRPLLTPVRVTYAGEEADGGSGMFPVDFPSVPQFGLQTPQTKVEVGDEAETLNCLRIRDLDTSSDSGHEMDDDGASLFLGGGATLEPKFCRKDILESASPGRHAMKRRAHSRVGSDELKTAPKPSLFQFHHTGFNSNQKGLASPPAHKSTSRRPTSPSSATHSPVMPWRIHGAMGPPTRPNSPTQLSTRVPFNRMKSESSATLFFGPEIHPRDQAATSVSETYHANITARHTSALSSNGHRRPEHHSSRNASPLARYSSPLPTDEDDFSDEELSIEAPADTSFSFSIVSGTPSPRSNNDRPVIQKKYKARDSGVVLSDEDSGGDFLSLMPAASSSVSTIHSSCDEGLVTPGFGPSYESAWPNLDSHVEVASHDDDEGSDAHSPMDQDAFIMQALTVGVKEDKTAVKKMPGTPVKKFKTTYLAHEKPWHSAFTSKIGFDFEDCGKGIVQGKGKPRKSMPAAFPSLGLGKGRGKREADDDSTDEENEISPTAGRDNRYDGLGLGRPSARVGQTTFPKFNWLRRSSSGAFSSGSETSAPGSVSGTPTKFRGKALLVPAPIRTQLCATTNTLQVSSSTSSSSTSTTPIDTPSAQRRVRNLPISGNQLPVGRQRTKSNFGQRDPVTSPFISNSTRINHDQRHSAPFRERQHGRQRSRDHSVPAPPWSAEEHSGRFERDFVVLDELGRGEFGQVVKVKYRHGDEKVYAVKKSKRIEGMRRRLRLREEADILKHLSSAARGDHPNLLGYIDSWEEDEALYIHTELCEAGNFAHFLWQVGQHFQRLDETRVWRIIVDLSNGLRFIHDNGVIHLDLKPANIFVTGEGRLKIGDFGMASIWPRPHGDLEGFEREGDKIYLASEVLQEGRYGKAADIFSLGLTILETASNIVVPEEGEAYHNLRQEDFGQVDMEDRPELFCLIKEMMRANPDMRVTIGEVWGHPVVMRARRWMEKTEATARRQGKSLYCASPLAPVPDDFLEDILGRRVLDAPSDDSAMDVGP